MPPQLPRVEAETSSGISASADDAVDPPARESSEPYRDDQVALTTKLRREYLDMRERVAHSRERADRLRALADDAAQMADQDERLLRSLATALGIDPQLSLDGLDERLRGKRLREVAIEVLVTAGRAADAIHYREWFALIERDGWKVAGKNPIASFLTQISSAPQVERVGGKRSGRYLLREGELGANVGSGARETAKG